MRELPESRVKYNLAAACIYLACKQAGFPRTLDEMAVILGLDAVLLGRTQSAIARAFDLHSHPINPQSLIPRMATTARLSSSLAELARQLCSQLTTTYDTTKPQTLAAVCLLIVALGNRATINLDNLVASAHLSLASIQKMYVELKSELKKRCSSELLSRINLKDLPKSIDKAILAELRNSYSSRQLSSIQTRETPVLDATERSSVSVPGSAIARKRPRAALFTANQSADKEFGKLGWFKRRLDRSTNFNIDTTSECNTLTSLLS